MPPTEPAAVAETHCAVVVFAGERAYKIKKPVRFGFLDFSTRDKRAAALWRELDLNRRLAPDVYLGVLDVTDPDGRPCEPVLVMRRMAAGARLAGLVVAGGDVADCLRGVARSVAAFHAGASTDPQVAAAGTRDAVAGNWERNFAETAPFVGDVLDEDVALRVESLARGYLAGRAPLFEARIGAGLVRDGHGDLLCDDIFCRPEGPAILDCIEFDDRLRWGDVLADVAFLAMDLERLGRPDLAGTFLRDYREFSGEHHPESLAHHYVAYRAQVRAKVACLRHAQGDADAAALGGRLLGLCRAHLEAARVRLVLVGGAPGTGKSTLAAALGEARGWAVLRSDVVRKELAGLPPGTPAPAAPGGGIYSPGHTGATYTALRERAGALLGMGESVVLDASWTDPAERDAAERLGDSLSADVVALRCDCPPHVAAARIGLRRAEGGDASDADAAVAAALRAAAGPWPDAVDVDTSAGAAGALGAALALVGPSGVP